MSETDQAPVEVKKKRKYRKGLATIHVNGRRYVGDSLRHAGKHLILEGKKRIYVNLDLVPVVEVSGPMAAQAPPEPSVSTGASTLPAGITGGLATLAARHAKNQNRALEAAMAMPPMHDLDEADAS